MKPFSITPLELFIVGQPPMHTSTERLLLLAWFMLCHGVLAACLQHTTTRHHDGVRKGIDSLRGYSVGSGRASARGFRPVDGWCGKLGQGQQACHNMERRSSGSSGGRTRAAAL